MSKEGNLVACRSHYETCLALGRTRGLQCAFVGLQVQRRTGFEGEPSGRVGSGVGRVTDPDFGLGNIVVYWRDDGDFTQWTRAGPHGMDVVTAPLNKPYRVPA